MVWTTMPTWSPNQVIPSSFLNLLRDNLNETAVARASTAGGYFVATGANAIAERFITEAVVDTSQTTASTTFTNLATDGPTLAATTGVKALVWINCELANSASGTTIASFEVTGATTQVSDSQHGIMNDAGVNTHRSGVCSLVALTAGSNTFRMQYKVTSGTGTFKYRRLQAMAL